MLAHPLLSGERMQLFALQTHPIAKASMRVE